MANFERRMTACLFGVLLASCSQRVDVDPESEKILAGARRAMGGAAAAGVTTLHTRADVRGPRSAFVTLVWSAVDGRARMEQSGFIAVVHPNGDWQMDTKTGDPSPLEAEVLSTLYGHELHMTALSPLSRYPRARFAGRQQFDGAASMAVAFAGVFGEPVFIYYSVTDTLPLGFRMTRPEPDDVVSLDDWVVEDGVRLFSSATFVQGTESFEYSYTDIELNSVLDSTFVSRYRHLAR